MFHLLKQFLDDLRARKAHKDLRDLLDYAKSDLTNLRDLANEIEKRMEKVRGML